MEIASYTSDRCLRNPKRGMHVCSRENAFLFSLGTTVCQHQQASSWVRPCCTGLKRKKAGWRSIPEWPEAHYKLFLSDSVPFPTFSSLLKPIYLFSANECFMMTTPLVGKMPAGTSWGSERKPGNHCWF